MGRIKLVHILLALTSNIFLWGLLQADIPVVVIWVAIFFSPKDCTDEKGTDDIISCCGTYSYITIQIDCCEEYFQRGPDRQTCYYYPDPPPDDGGDGIRFTISDCAHSELLEDLKNEEKQEISKCCSLATAEAEVKSECCKTYLPSGQFREECLASVVQTSVSSLPVNSTSCFSATSTVEVWGKGTLAVQDLEIGDRVENENDEFETVYAFGHVEPQARADFIQIFTSSRKPLEVTEQHLIYLHGKPNPVPAGAIRIGDWLQGGSGMPYQVTNIETVKKTGLFAPLTASGTLLVDGMKTSCYVNLQGNHQEYTLFQNGVSTGISQHNLVHMALAPFRMICMAGISTMLCESYNNNGMPYAVTYGLEFAKFVQELPTAAQVLLLAVYVSIFGAFLVLECFLSYMPRIIGGFILTYVSFAGVLRSQSLKAKKTV